MADPEEYQVRPAVTLTEVSRAEGRALLDRAARRDLGISGDEFLRRLDAGDYDGDEDPAVTSVEMLVPFAR